MNETILDSERFSYVEFRSLGDASLYRSKQGVKGLIFVHPCRVLLFNEGVTESEIRSIPATYGLGGEIV